MNEQETQEQEMTEQVETDQGQALIVWQPADVTAIHGMRIPATASHAEKLQALQMVSRLIGVVSERIDPYLNVPIMIQGCAMHDVEVRVNQPGEDDKFRPAVRTVIQIVGVAGKRLPEPRPVAFVAKSAQNYFENFIIPLFGSGWWEEPVPLIVRKVSARGGQAYAFEIPED